VRKKSETNVHHGFQHLGNSYQEGENPGYVEKEAIKMMRMKGSDKRKSFVFMYQSLDRILTTFTVAFTNAITISEIESFI